MIEWLHSLHSAEGISQIIQAGGLIVLIAIVFSETGLLVGFFLPGDSLLITAGILANPANPNHVPSLSIWMLNILLMIAAVVGDQTGFYLGGKVGDRIWDRPDGRFYKRRYLDEAHAFYMKHGGLAIFAARYIPILRTFVPFAAGVARMPYRNFVLWNVFGGMSWITSILWAGYWLGKTHLAKSLDRIIVIVILVSFVPIVIGVVKRWQAGRRSLRGTDTVGK